MSLQIYLFVHSLFCGLKLWDVRVHMCVCVCHVEGGFTCTLPYITLQHSLCVWVWVCERAGGGAYVFAAWWSSSLLPHAMILTAEQNIKTQTLHTTLQKCPLAFSSTEIWIHNIQALSQWHLCEKCCRFIFINVQTLFGIKKILL